jgi:hypothetical protein
MYVTMHGSENVKFILILHSHPKSYVKFQSINTNLNHRPSNCEIQLRNDHKEVNPFIP